MNTTQLNGKWNQIKGMLVEKYGELTGNDLAKVRGDVGKLIGVFAEKAGIAREDVEHFVSQSLDRASTVVNRVSSAAKTYVDDVTHFARDGYEQVSDCTRQQFDRTRTAVKNKPVEAVAIAVGVGAIAGLATALLISRQRQK